MIPTPEAIAQALAEQTLPEPPAMKTLEFTVSHPGLDGYERPPLVHFIGRMRTAALAESRLSGWPHPLAVASAEVGIVAYGTDRCGAKTVAQIAHLIGKHVAAGALTIADPVKVKQGPPRIVVTVRAIEIVALEDPGDKAVRLAKEMAPPQIRQDGSYEGELRAYESPASSVNGPAAVVHPLDEQLDRAERSVQLPGSEDESDPPSVINSEDPDSAMPGWIRVMKYDHGGSGSGGGHGRKHGKVFADPMCQCGDRASDHGEPDSGIGCLKCSTCSAFIQGNSGGRPRRGTELREVVSARIDPGTRAAFAKNACSYGDILDLAAELMRNGVDVVSLLEAPESEFDRAS